MKKSIIFVLLLCTIFTLNAQSTLEDYYLEKVYLIDGISKSQKEAIAAASIQEKAQLAQLVKKAYLAWDDVAVSYGGINEIQKNSFVSYHFYVDLKHVQSPLALKINKNLPLFLKKDTIKYLINDMAYTKAKKDSYNLIKEEDPKLISILNDILLEQITEALNTNKDNKDHLYKAAINFKSYKSLLRTAKAEFSKIKKEESYKEIAKKAKAAHLNDHRISKLITLIREKDESIVASKAAKKSVDTGFFEMSTGGKTKKEIQKAFTQSVTKLITKDEYAQILGDALQPLAKKKADAEMQKVGLEYTLNDEQQKVLYKHIHLYYFNEAITNYYYGYDRPLVRQKLSGLRYHFEKEYKKIMDGFNLPVKNSKAVNNNTYQY